MRNRLLLTITVFAFHAISQQSLLAVDFYVDLANANKAPPFTNGWASAANSIQEAVDQASEGDTVWIRPGDYVAPAIPTNYGGFDTVVYMNFMISLRADPETPGQVIINGEGQNRGIVVNRPSSTPHQLKLEGLVISNCVITALEGDATAVYGAGLRLVPPAGGSSPWDVMIERCSFIDNRAVAVEKAKESRGGAIYVSANTGRHALTITDCSFINNMASNTVAQGAGRGGAIYARLYPSSAVLDIRHTIFSNNLASLSGGAVAMDGTGSGIPVYTNCRFFDNKTVHYRDAGSGGGAVSGRGRFRNCLLTGNSVPGSCYGGAIFTSMTGPLYVENCTIVSNKAPNGSGVLARPNSVAHYTAMTNSIVYYNEGGSDYSTTKDADTNQIDYISFSCLGSTTKQLIEGSNNVDAAPGFVDWTAGDFHLKSGSPCINAGANLDWMKDTPDLDGNKRINWGITDLGAYEYQMAGSALLVR